MNKKLLFLVIFLICLPLIACSGSGSPEAVAPAESTEIDQPEAVVETPPAESSEIDRVYVTTVDQIVGTWVASADQGIFVVVISPDGIFRVASSSVDLEKGSTDSWQLTIEDERIVASGYALCLGEIGHYLGEIKSDGTLKFTTISDPCTGRLRKMDRSLPGRLTPYDLVFHPVE